MTRLDGRTGKCMEITVWEVLKSIQKARKHSIVFLNLMEEVNNKHHRYVYFSKRHWVFTRNIYDIIKKLSFSTFRVSPSVRDS